MKKIKAVYWITLSVIFIWLGIAPLFAYDDPTSVEVILHLGYPYYFPLLITCFKVLGMLVIVIPSLPNRIKEWAYAGFTFDLVCAIFGFIIIDGYNPHMFLPITALLILISNYICISKIKYNNA